ncbi:MAG TPA: hypothetical protein VLF59_01535 [Candidatus Saccharimonadales bacterium]|nr:hypothetical protein [Candidatus Saccharimonadales bacterium]
MAHLIITIAIIIIFALISLIMNRITLIILKLKPTWRQVFSITGTIFLFQLAMALPALINPKISIGPMFSLVSIIVSIILWCVFLRKFFQAKLLKSLLGVVIFYGLTALTVGIILAVIHVAKIS